MLLTERLVRAQRAVCNIRCKGVIVENRALCGRGFLPVSVGSLGRFALGASAMRPAQTTDVSQQIDDYRIDIDVAPLCAHLVHWDALI